MVSFGNLGAIFHGAADLVEILDRKEHAKSAELLADLSIISDKVVFDQTLDGLKDVDGEKIFDELPNATNLTSADQAKLKQRINYNLEHKRELAINQAKANEAKDNVLSATKMFNSLHNGIAAGVTNRVSAHQSLMEIDQFLGDSPVKNKLMDEFSSSAEFAFIDKMVKQGLYDSAESILNSEEARNILKPEHFHSLQASISAKRNIRSTSSRGNKYLKIIKSAIYDTFLSQEDFLNYARTQDPDSLVDYERVWLEAGNIKTMSPQTLDSLIKNPNISKEERDIYSERKAYVNKKLGSDPIELAFASGLILSGDIDLASIDAPHLLDNRITQAEYAQEVYNHPIYDVLSKSERAAISTTFKDPEKLDEQFNILKNIATAGMDSHKLASYTNDIAPMVVFALRSGISEERAKSMLLPDLQNPTRLRYDYNGALVFPFRPDLAKSLSSYMMRHDDFLGEKVKHHTDSIGNTFSIITKNNKDIFNILKSSNGFKAVKLINQMSGGIDKFYDYNGAEISLNTMAEAFPSNFAFWERYKSPLFMENGQGKYFMFLKAADGQQTQVFSKDGNKLRPLQLDVFRVVK